MEDTLDRIVQSLFHEAASIGVAVGVIDHGRITTRGYGTVRDTVPSEPQLDTLFEIGSVTKVFTTSLLAIMVANKLVQLDDAVCDLLPRLAQLPADITLGRLASHTSGLPKMPPQLFWRTLRQRHNPFATYSTHKLLTYLAQYQPRRRRTDHIHYSNLGLALLGHVLAAKLGTTYERALISQMCDPLNLPDTRITLTAPQNQRFAPPHTAKGKSARRWELPAFAGAGAMRSTTADMVMFLMAHLGHPRSPLTEALQRCQEQQRGVFTPSSRIQTVVSRGLGNRRTVPLKRTGIGLGWIIGQVTADAPPAYWHHGATGGYLAFAGFVKRIDAGVTVLMNRGPRLSELLTGISLADTIGFRVLDALCATR